MKNVACHFKPVGFWAPRSLAYWMLRPRMWHTISHRPISVRFSKAADWPYRNQGIVRWTYDPSEHGKRLCLEFANASVADVWRFRWRVLANTLWALIDDHPRIVFHGIPVDMSDCNDCTVPVDVLRFAKLPGDPHQLLPNPYLLEHDSARLRAIPWRHKSDAVYFRGAATGFKKYETNRRVAACLVTRRITGGDCKLTSFSDVGQEFIDRAAEDGITAWPTKPRAMERYRYLLDIDGHTSSWDRYQKIGMCEAVPIRFETEWRECWHDLFIEGVHYKSATRTTLEEVVCELRDTPRRARDIAAQARSFVEDSLSVASMRQRLEHTWLARIRDSA